MNKKPMTVHEVVNLTGITARTLHYYDEIGLLKPSIVTEAKYSLQGTTQGRYLTGGVPPVRFSM